MAKNRNQYRQRVPRRAISDRTISKAINVKFTPWKRFLTSKKQRINRWPKRSNHPGYRKRGANFPKYSGLYEFKTHKRSAPVYLGKSKDLNRRLKSYSYNGSHSRWMDNQLRRGQDIYVRTARTSVPRRKEKRLLNAVKYAYNRRR